VEDSSDHRMTMDDGLLPRGTAASGQVGTIIVIVPRVLIFFSLSAINICLID